MTELAITVRNEDQSLTQKELEHSETITVSHDDPVLAQLVRKAVEAFEAKGEKALDVLVKIKFEW